MCIRYLEARSSATHYLTRDYATCLSVRWFVWMEGYLKLRPVRMRMATLTKKPHATVNGPNGPNGQGAFPQPPFPYTQW